LHIPESNSPRLGGTLRHRSTGSTKLGHLSMISPHYPLQGRIRVAAPRLGIVPVTATKTPTTGPIGMAFDKSLVPPTPLCDTMPSVQLPWKSPKRRPARPSPASGDDPDHTKRVTSKRALSSHSRPSRSQVPRSRPGNPLAESRTKSPGDGVGPVLISRGREFSRKELGTIKKLAEEYRSASRTRLSQEVCRVLDWRQPNGWLKERACRDVLLLLEKRRLLRLPPRRQVPNNLRLAKRQASSFVAEIDTSPITVVDFGSVELTRVRGGEAETHWNELVTKYHYLGFQVFVGRSMKYLITCNGRVVGAIGWCDPSWSVDSRDRILLALGYSRDGIRHHGINNGRFLIFPWVRVPNLASRILGLASRRVCLDWEEYYSVAPAYLETFVDTTRYRGTSYFAANWYLVGHTRGYRKRGRVHANSQTTKAVLLYPFDKRIREALARPRDGHDQP